MWENLHLEVVLLHVTEPVHEGLRIQTDDLHEKMRKAAGQQLKELADNYFPGAGEKISLKIVEGRAAEMICRTAAEEKVDVIIIPTHGHSGLKHMLVGSVAEKVVRQAGCDVLVVRPS
jgi:universal stress protein A